MSWEIKQLEELADIVDSLHQTPKYSEVGLPMVRVTEIKGGYLNLENTFKVEEKVFEEFSKKHKSQKGDIVMSRVGTYGISSYVADDTPFCLGQNTLFILPKIDNKFLYYSLITPNTKSQIEGFATGASQKTISLKSIKGIKIPTAIPATQRKIGCMLSAYDDLIENNLRRIKLLEEKAFCEYKLVTDFKRTETLGQVLKLNYGKSLSADNRKPGIYPVYGSSGAVGFNESFLVKGPGVILGRKGNVGTVFWSHSDFFPIDTVYYVESEISLFFLYFNLKHSQYFDNSDAAVPGLNRTSALGNKIHLPSLDAIKAFEEYCKPIFTLINVLQQQNTKLREARDILLPKLMSGKIEL